MSAASILAALQTDAGIQSSEEFQTSDLQRYVEDAAEEHNPAYTGDTVPAPEQRMVLLLAMIRVAEIRAHAFGLKADQQEPGMFKIAANGLFQNQLNLIKQLKAKYEMWVRKSGLDPATVNEGVVMSQAVRESDYFLGAQVPLSLSPLPATAVLAVEQTIPNGSPNLILTWAGFKPFGNFMDFSLYQLTTSTDVIYKDYVPQSDTFNFPRINPLALNIGIYYSQDIIADQFTIDETQTQHFIGVMRSRSLRYSYTNEIVLAPF